MTKQIVCQDCGGYGFIRTVHNENSVSARGCSTCGSTGLIDVSLTNADRIRAMSDEELCEFLAQYVFHKMCEEGCDACTYNGDCDKRLLDWLKQPAED